MSATPRDGGPVIDPEDPTGPGAQLREARHRANLSLEEVATQLRLDRRTVRALEENEFQHLPAPTFIRGYIRSYARLLGLPPGPILEAYDYQGFTPPAILADITQRPQARSSDIAVRLATYLVAAGLVAMVVMWWHSRESAPARPAGADFVAGSPAGIAQGAALQAEVPGPPAPPAEELVSAEGRADTAPAQSVADAAPEAPARELQQPAQAAADSVLAPGDTDGGTPMAPSTVRTVPLRDALVSAREAPAVPTSGQPQSTTSLSPTGRLTIRFQEESWVEIFDAEGIQREFRLATPGSTTSVSGTPPFNVLLGYAAGATVNFDGEGYDISRYIRGNTARFLIGRDGLARARPPQPPPEPTEANSAAADAEPTPSPLEAAAPTNPAQTNDAGAN
ncbi:MAG: DUF4115 domain-containing protein [Gammaproteobacteria bacterium]|nr:DUF4115 domain-containing protein [Gammaproteobacteria bacterium]MDH3414222.1 DUF4115 domain-containing protein [Gammaproteobacteria bacterium]